jgi:hypothetical protein
LPNFGKVGSERPFAALSTKVGNGPNAVIRTRNLNGGFVRTAVITRFSPIVRFFMKRSFVAKTVVRQSPMTAQYGTPVIRQKPSDDRNEP